MGLDVVKTAVDDLGGTIDVFSELGAGTSFVLTLPITLGVLRCLIARVGSERYAVPVPAVIESLSLRDVAVDTVAGVPVVIRHGVTVPLLDLGSALGVEGEREPRAALVCGMVGRVTSSRGRSTASRVNSSSWSKTSARSSAGCRS